MPGMVFMELALLFRGVPFDLPNHFMQHLRWDVADVRLARETINGVVSFVIDYSIGGVRGQPVGSIVGWIYPWTK